MVLDPNKAPAGRPPLPTNLDPSVRAWLSEFADYAEGRLSSAQATLTPQIRNVEHAWALDVAESHDAMVIQAMKDRGDQPRGAPPMEIGVDVTLTLGIRHAYILASGQVFTLNGSWDDLIK